MMAFNICLRMCSWIVLQQDEAFKYLDLQKSSYFSFIVHVLFLKVYDFAIIRGWSNHSKELVKKFVSGNVGFLVIILWII
jgi:hypothetical protein